MWSTIIEPEKKGSKWPWILVPVAAFSIFFGLRECQEVLRRLVGTVDVDDDGERLVMRAG